jgi:O-methyltransferase
MHPNYREIRDDRFWQLYDEWSGESLLSVERLFNLYQSIEYIERVGIDGAIVECGTYKGGAAALFGSLLASLGNTMRPIFLYDTFDGFPADTHDVNLNGEKLTREAWITENFRAITERNLSKVPHSDRYRIIVGPVEETVPAQAPEKIALLHLDTDYYRSTLHELTHLYPRLVSGGVLVVDDYGHFEGARQAVDEYMSAHRPPLLLHRVDYSGRVAVKP